MYLTKSFIYFFFEKSIGLVCIGENVSKSALNTLYNLKVYMVMLKSVIKSFIGNWLLVETVVDDLQLSEVICCDYTKLDL